MNLKQTWNLSALEIPNNKSQSNYAIQKEKLFPKQSDVLDLGGGSGADAVYFLKKGHKVLLVDISDVSLDKFYERTVQEKISEESFGSMEFDLNDAIIPIKDETFDVVYSRLALHYFSQETTKKIFQEIFRVLKKGGQAFLTLKSPNDKDEMAFLLTNATSLAENVFEDQGVVKSRYTLEQLESILKEAQIKKFKVKEIDEDLGKRKDKIKSGAKKFILNEVVITR